MTTLKKTIHLIIITILYPNFELQPQCFWAKQIGGTSLERVYSSTIDFNGNIYSTGYFQGVCDFDPSQTNYNLVSNGEHDIFISKLDSNGNFLWARSIGGSGVDIGEAIVHDRLGNLYMTGRFSSIVDFDPGPGVFNLSTSNLGDDDVFILKLDSNGNFIWAKKIGGASGTDQGMAILVDSTSFYLAGNFQGTIDVDPNQGLYNLSSNGLDDIFLAKYSLNGALIWAKGIGGVGSDGLSSGNTIAIDSYSNIYMTGQFQSNINFNSGQNIFNLSSSGSSDIFFSKWDSQGNVVWAKKIGGYLADVATSISIDSFNNIYMAGGFGSIVDFDPSSNTTNLVSNGLLDLFVCKLDQNGNLIWAKSAGGVGNDIVTALSVDKQGKVVLGGIFQQSVDFNPGTGNNTMVENGSGDVFILLLDSLGNFVWSRQVGGGDYDLVYKILTDSKLGIFVFGSFYSQIDVNPDNTGSYYLNSKGLEDIFILKIEPEPTIIGLENPFCEGDTFLISANISNGITWSTGETTSSIRINQTGIYSFSINNEFCSASSNPRLINFNPAFFISQNLNICEGAYVTVGSNDYTSSGEYYDTLLSSAGCDSIVFTRLAVESCINSNSFVQGGIKIYPTVVQNNLHVKINQNLLNSRVYVVNSLGSILKVEFLSELDNDIDFSNFQTGTYTIIINDYHHAFMIIKI